MDDDLDILNDNHTPTHVPFTIDIDTENQGFSASQYSTATQDDVNGDIFYDALDCIDSSNDVFYVSLGDFTI
jgi:hypothetical protein